VKSRVNTKPWVVFSLLLQLLVAGTKAQTDSLPSKKGTAKAYRPEIFTSGFIDIVNNGQLNASARFVRLLIGEPGRFALPLSLFSGVSANAFQGPGNGNGASNEQLINNYINPLSGIVNLSVDGILYKKPRIKLTKLGMLYHFGERLLTGYKTGAIGDPQLGKGVNFLNSFASLGLYFQTAAWERANEKNVGAFWLVGRYHFCYTNPTQLKNFLPDIVTNGIYTGYSLGFGIEISNLLNFKTVYYRYIKQPEIFYSLPIYQFSFNYAIK
jgi:hypothetical protein